MNSLILFYLLLFYLASSTESLLKTCTTLRSNYRNNYQSNCNYNFYHFSRLKVTQPTEQNVDRIIPNIKLQDYFFPPFTDGVTISLNILGNIILLNFSFLVSVIYIILTANSLVLSNQLLFTWENMTNIIEAVAPLIASNVILFGVLALLSSQKNQNNNIRFYALRLLGRQTSTPMAIVVSFIISGQLGNNYCHMHHYY